MIPGGLWLIFGMLVICYVVLWTYTAGNRLGSKINTFIWTIVATGTFVFVLLFGFWIDGYLNLNTGHLIFEIPIVGFLIVAFIRTRFLMHAPLTMGNLFGHLNIFTEFSMKIDPKLHNYPNEKKSNILEHKKTI